MSILIILASVVGGITTTAALSALFIAYKNSTYRHTYICPCGWFTRRDHWEESGWSTSSDESSTWATKQGGYITQPGHSNFKWSIKGLAKPSYTYCPQCGRPWSDCDTFSARIKGPFWDTRVQVAGHQTEKWIALLQTNIDSNLDRHMALMRTL